MFCMCGIIIIAVASVVILMVASIVVSIIVVIIGVIVIIVGFGSQHDVNMATVDGHI